MKREWLLPVATFLVLGGLSVVIWAGVRQQARARLELQTQLTCEQVAVRLREAIAARIAVAQAVRELVRAGDVTEDSYREHVLALQRRFPGLLAVNWIDAEGVIRRVVPAGPNARALGRDLREHPQVGALVRASIADGQDRFSRPIALYQGGLGFTGYLPVRRDDRLVALLNPVFRTSSLLGGVLSQGGLDEAFSIVIRDGRIVHEQLLPGTPMAGVVARQTFPVGTRTWGVELRPGPELVAASSTPAADLAALLGLIVALALALAVRAQLRSAAERRALVSQLEQRQRLETIGTLAGGVAHEYNNHLTALLGFNEIAQRALDSDPATVRDALEQSGAVIERSRQVVDQILTFARKRELEVKQVRLAPVVREVGRLFETTLPAAVQVVVEQGLGEEVVIQGDSGRVHQVLTNLMTNAAQALGDGGGSVRLAAAVVEVGDHPRLPPGSYAELRVSDDGAGIPPEVQARLFEPFFTTKPTGTGLGLSVTHGIVLEHGGEIEVASAPGDGTTMRVLLPCATAPLPEPDAEPAPQLPVPGATILLVEDDPMVQRMMRAVLDEGGFRVEACGSAEEATTRLEGAPVDLLLTDDALPGLSGVELGARVQEQQPGLPMVLMSGCPPVSEDDLRAKGFGAFVAKPFDVDALLETVERLLRESSGA